MLLSPHVVVQLRPYATSHEVAGSIPDGVMESVVHVILPHSP
jgi:hypothetical protein